jgi:hypothetical protein
MPISIDAIKNFAVHEMRQANKKYIMIEYLCMLLTANKLSGPHIIYLVIINFSFIIFHYTFYPTLQTIALCESLSESFNHNTHKVFSQKRIAIGSFPNS